MLYLETVLTMDHGSCDPGVILLVEHPRRGAPSLSTEKSSRCDEEAAKIRPGTIRFSSSKVPSKERLHLVVHNVQNGGMLHLAALETTA